MSSPILVTGSNRSGTTWLGKLLAAADGVAYINELFNLDHPQPGLCAARFPHWFMYLTEDNGRAYVEPIGRTLRFEYDWSDAVRTATSPRNALRAMRALPKTRVPEGSRPLLKDPLAVFSATWMARTFGMQVVLSVRHPAAFAASLERLSWEFDFGQLLAQPLLMRDHLEPYRSRIEQCSRDRPDIIDQACLLWTVIYGTVGDDAWLTVRQEDVALQPEVELHRLYTKLGLTWSDEVAGRVVAATREGNPTQAPHGRAHTSALDSRAAVNAWRQRLSPEQVARVYELTASVSSRYYSDNEW